MNKEKTARIEEVKSWILEAGSVIKEKLNLPLVVEEKSSRTDLVTNMDKETEAFFVGKIRENYPEDHILGEEGLGDNIQTTEGRIWIIDPIDGTLNFVKQQENFCIMLAIFEDGIGELGFIYNVMAEEFVWGGRGIGAYIGEKKVEKLQDVALSDGLLGINAYMYLHNKQHAQEIGEASSGVRMYGCAGIEFIQIIKGNQIGYISNLAPWDYAAGTILVNELGIKTSKLSGEPLEILTRAAYIAITPKAYAEVQSRFFSE